MVRDPLRVVDVGRQMTDEPRFTFHFTNDAALVVRGEAVITDRIDFTHLAIRSPAPISLTGMRHRLEETRDLLASAISPSLWDGMTVLGALARGSGVSLPPRLSARVELAESEAERAIASIKRTRPKRGTAARGDDWSRKVAVMYLRHVQQGEPYPVKSMTEELDRTKEHHPLSRHTVSSWIRRARDEGWLSEGTRGRAGGVPGPKLVAWLEHQEAKS